MSKIIEATNKLINGDKEALSLVDKITDDLFETHYDFEDINCVNTTKELLAGHIVYYGLSKIKSIAKDGYSERTNYIIQNWMRTRNTIEFLGLWEQLDFPQSF